MSEHESEQDVLRDDDYEYVPGGRRRKGRGAKGCIAVLVALALDALDGLPHAVSAEEAIGDLPPITLHREGKLRRGARRADRHPRAGPPTRARRFSHRAGTRRNGDDGGSHRGGGAPAQGDR